MRVNTMRKALNMLSKVHEISWENPISCEVVRLILVRMSKGKRVVCPAEPRADIKLQQ